MAARIWRWREDSAAALWQEAGALIGDGRVVALPTETFYALAVHPFREDALGRLFALKARGPEKPVLVLVASPAMVTQVAASVPELARRLMARFWPGPLTLILPARPELPELLTGGTGTVGVRQPRQAVTCRLIETLGMPVTGTSANRAGGQPLTRAAEVEREFGEGVSLILDTGPCPGGKPSTVLDVSVSPPRLVRPGAVARSELTQFMAELGHSLR